MMIPRPEHPKPQFYRENWMNLNGEWDFEFDFGNSNRDCLQKPESAFGRKIIVPFCPESKLSGIEYKDFMNAVWYRKKVEIADALLENRVLLHFGAVDYHADIFINGEAAGSHDGGYSSFSFDITKYLKGGINEITVRAVDDLRSGSQPKGKQCSQYLSQGCDYTRTTGIWQTVWLEFVNRTYIDSVRVDTDYLSGIVSFTAKVAGEAEKLSIRTTVSYNGEIAGQTVVEVSSGITRYSVTIAEPRLWDVLAPNLYDVSYELVKDGNVIDSVKSYFGIRTVEVKNHAVYLNGRPLFQRLVLDQGFYSDGIYTAPSEECFRQDIEMSIALGFNGARFHQKVFEERCLYWADKLGYLVWGEHANWGLDITSAEGIVNFLPEWIEVVERDYNHPSIIGWCPFNETWDYDGVKQDDDVLKLVYLTTKAIDKTRPVIDTSGNFHVVTDIYDIHDYEQEVDKFKEHYSAMKVGERVYDNFPNRQKYEGQPYFVSEYGGAWWAPGRTEGWGYGTNPASEEEFAQRYAGLTNALLSNENICAFCYTQLYDVEQEQNGLYTYERKPKFSDKIYKAIRETNTSKAAIE